jgi:hypothetical protein
MIIIRQIIENNTNNSKEVDKKTAPYFLLLFVSLIVVIVYINIYYSGDEYEKENLDEVVDDVPIIPAKNQLSEIEKYLDDNGFEYENIDSTSFILIKRILENPKLKHYDFCQLCYDLNQMSNKDYNSKMNELKKVDKDFETFYLYLVGLCNQKIQAIVREKKLAKSTTYVNTSDVNPCMIAIDFIKKDLYNPSTLDYSLFDCEPEWSGNQVVMLRKISAKNQLGVEREYIYKLRLEYLGGHENDLSSWKLIGIQSEEYR